MTENLYKYNPNVFERGLELWTFSRHYLEKLYVRNIPSGDRELKQTLSYQQILYRRLDFGLYHRKMRLNIQNFLCYFVFYSDFVLFLYFSYMHAICLNALICVRHTVQYSKSICAYTQTHTSWGQDSPQTTTSARKHHISAYWNYTEKDTYTWQNLFVHKYIFLLCGQIFFHVSF